MENVAIFLFHKEQTCVCTLPFKNLMSPKVNYANIIMVVHEIFSQLTRIKTFQKRIHRDVAKYTIIFQHLNCYLKEWDVHVCRTRIADIIPLRFHLGIFLHITPTYVWWIANYHIKIAITTIPCLRLKSNVSAQSKLNLKSVTSLSETANKFNNILHRSIEYDCISMP